MKKENAFPNVIIRASAGTGKTYQLAVRFIGLLAAGARPDEILATTFTRTPDTGSPRPSTKRKRISPSRCPSSSGGRLGGHAHRGGGQVVAGCAGSRCVLESPELSTCSPGRATAPGWMATPCG